MVMIFFICYTHSEVGKNKSSVFSCSLGQIFKFQGEKPSSISMYTQFRETLAIFNYKKAP